MNALAREGEGDSPRISIRLPPQKLACLDEIAARNGLDRSTVARLLIDRGLRAAREDAVARSTTR
jgi:hypothetical protein